MGAPDGLTRSGGGYPTSPVGRLSDRRKVRGVELILEVIPGGGGSKIGSAVVRDLPSGVCPRFEWAASGRSGAVGGSVSVGDGLRQRQAAYAGEAGRRYLPGGAVVVGGVQGSVAVSGDREAVPCSQAERVDVGAEPSR